MVQACRESMHSPANAIHPLECIKRFAEACLPVPESDAACIWNPDPLPSQSSVQMGQRPELDISMISSRSSWECPNSLQVRTCQNGLQVFSGAGGKLLGRSSALEGLASVRLADASSHEEGSALLQAVGLADG